MIPPHRLLIIRDVSIAAFLLANVTAASAQQGKIVEPPLPNTADHAGQGYFPTLRESALLRGPSNSRSLGGMFSSEEGPDVRKQTASDLFPYEDSQTDYYERNQNFFKPIDKTLGWFTPNNAWTTEFSSLNNTSLTVDGSLGVLTRQFSPELATLKAGPLYLDLLWIGAGAVWSDYNGSLNFANTGIKGNNGDGTLAYLSLGMRGLLRLTDTIYLSATANLLYFPLENQIALQFGNGRNAALLARLNYSKTVGPWDLLVFDQFQAWPGLNFYGDGNVTGGDRAGRYFYGYQTNGPSNEFYNRNYVLWSNRIGVSASRLVFENQWRLWLIAEHSDFWRSMSFSNHQRREHLGAALGYEGSHIPFAPRMSYDIYSYGQQSTLQHRAALNLTGRLTENLDWGGMVGYTYSTGPGNNFNRFMWTMSFDHTLTRNTKQWVWFGDSVNDNSATNASIYSRFISYGVDHRVSKTVNIRGFVQYAQNEIPVANSGQQTKDRISLGMTVQCQPLDFTQIIASAVYDNADQLAPSIRIQRWRYRLTAMQQLGLRLTGNLYYQYEDQSASGVADFTEHVVGLSLMRYF